MTSHTVNQELRIILGVIGALWAIHVLDWIVPGSFLDWGLEPRRLGGLPGIVTMPFIHANIWHLLGNTIPLFVLLALLAGSRTNSIATVIQIVLLNGLLLWCFGRRAEHVGASGLIYGLIAFLIAAGYFERRFTAMAIAAVVLFLYGTTLLWGILPTAGYNISWDGHLTGAIAGVVVAYAQWNMNQLRSEKLSASN